MLNQTPESVNRVTCIGAGPIGGGWAAHFLARGYRVTSYLHDAAEYDALMRLLETAWASLEAIGLTVVLIVSIITAAAASNRIQERARSFR